MREESLRLQETMLLSVSAEEDDEDDDKSPPITLVPYRFSSVAGLISGFS